MPTLSHARLLEVLEYEAATGLFRRKIGHPRVPVGHVAGCIKADGYVYVTIDRQKFLGHRLAWFYEFGAWPTSGLDHSNRVRSDNRLCNLREATISQNAANGRTKNKTGLKGVELNPTAKTPRYVARLFHNKKNLYLGSYSSPEEAHQAYMKAARGIYGDFAAN